MHTKKIFVTGIGILMLGLVVLTSCEKTFDEKISTTNDLNKSYIQLFVATVNANRNLVSIDNQRVSRPTLTSGTGFPFAVYPSTAAGTSFAVAGGLHNFVVRDTSATTTQQALNFAATLEPSKNYTIFMYDTITSPKQITVETPIEIPADGSARLRFANFIYSPNAVPAVEVFSKTKNQVIFSNVNKTEVTGFIPYTQLVNDTLVIRETGTTTVLAQFNNFAPSLQRSYTLIYRGSDARGTYPGTRTATIFANR
ncbi:MAG: DUF4397 domain-containing protein [Chitinophagaceae bacterium]|nr:DUF4397 domain-containing protein [Chitinophagaceae bacterium]